MRVLFLTHRLPYAPNRGDRLRAFHIIAALRQFAEIDLVSFVHDDEEEGHASDLVSDAVAVWPVRVHRSRNLMLLPQALATGRPLTHVLLHSHALRPTLDRVMASHVPDVILAYCSGMARFALDPPLNRIPLVLDMVDVDSEKWAALARVSSLPKQQIYRREARCLALFEERACRASAATLVVNARERADLSRRSPDARIEVVENGVDLQMLMAAARPAESSIVVFCGVMDYQPNVDGVLWFVRDVWPRVRGARPDATLLIVGAKPASSIRRLASQAGGIEVTGSVPDVRPYLRRAAVSVAPLWTGRGVQNKVLEAVACGLPCVITSVVRDGLPAAVLPACVTADLPSSFASAVADLLGLGAAARRSITETIDLAPLTWPRRLEQLRPILEEARSQPSPFDIESAHRS